MRAVLLINSLFTGGAEFSTLSLYQWLKKAGHEIRLVVLKEANPAYDPQDFGFDQVTVLGKTIQLSKLKSLRAIIKEFKPDLVHSVLFEANLLARMARIL